MVFAGIQKLSLLDYPGRVACTLFTMGCNFRCPWCHNAALVLPDSLPEGALDGEEVLRFLRKRQGVLDGVAITGGEPLMHAEALTAFLPEVKALGYRVKLDTNGSFPDALRKLVDAGLVDRVAMDVKNGPSRYGMTIGLRGQVPAAVVRTRDYLLTEPVEYEFRTTVVKGLHTEESLLEAAEWIRGAKVWVLQQFQDSGALIDGTGLSAFSAEEMTHLRDLLRETIPAVELRGVS